MHQIRQLLGLAVIANVVAADTTGLWYHCSPVCCSWISHRCSVSSTGLTAVTAESTFSAVNSHFCGFYCAMLCMRGTSHGPVSMSVCVCPSVKSRCSTNPRSNLRSTQVKGRTRAKSRVSIETRELRLSSRECDFPWINIPNIWITLVAGWMLILSANRQCQSTEVCNCQRL